MSVVDDHSQDSPHSRPVALLIRLATKRTNLLLAAIAILCTLPALWVGFTQDDRFFLSVFKGSPGLESLQTGPLQTFSFSDGDVEGNRIRVERGIMPWWAVEDWKIDLWRPLSSLSHLIDYRLFGERAWPMHVNSLLLYAALCVCAGLLYRRLISLPWVALLAGILFAIDGGHAIPVGWISNRNAILAALFGVLLLLSHDKWRRPHEGASPPSFFPHGILGLIWLTLALLSNEGAVALAGYLVAYALFLEPTHGTDGTGRWAWATQIRAFSTIAPYFVVIVVWRAIYSMNGHGVSGSWMYVDPLVDPSFFAINGLQRLPVLLTGLLAGPDSVLWNGLSPGWQIISAFAAGLFVAFVGWILWPLLKANAAARFFALGAVLAAVPACATIPSDRLLVFSSIGAMALIAQFLGAAAVKAEVPALFKSRRPVRSLAVVWIALHVVVSPFLLLGGSYVIAVMDRAFTSSNAGVPMLDPGDDTRFVVVNTPLDLLGSSLPLFRSGNGQTVPRNWWWLSAGSSPVEVKRIDERTISLRPRDGFLGKPWSQIFRRPESDPMHVNQRIQLSAMEALVTNVSDDGRPVEVHFSFDVPLEDSSLHWLTWVDGTYRPFELPELGQTVQAPGLDIRGVWRAARGIGPTPIAAVAEAKTGYESDS